MSTQFTLDAIDLNEPLKDCEQRLRLALQRRYLEEALQRAHGNIGDTAHLLKVSRRSVTAWVSFFQLVPASYYPEVRQARLAEKRGEGFNPANFIRVGG